VCPPSTEPPGSASAFAKVTRPRSGVNLKGRAVGAKGGLRGVGRESFWHTSARSTLGVVVVVEQPERSSIIQKPQQWELAGGKLRIARPSQTEAVVELCACTGELMERFSFSDQMLLEEQLARPDRQC
jgi:hypothetical protein